MAAAGVAEVLAGTRTHALVCGDCRAHVGSLPAEWAVVTDPPYGTNFDFGKKRRSRNSGLDWGGNKAKDVQRDWKRIEGDDRPFDPTPLLRFSTVILWGANNYADRLPASSCWLVWDKRLDTTPDDHSDCELAWTSLKGHVRKFGHLWRGIVRAGDENVTNGPKLHPAQKPIALMKWCLSFVPPEVVVVDPYAGSGTTLAACLSLGRRCLGFEVDPEYHAVASRRLEAVANSCPLFDPPPVQANLFDREDVPCE
jgi:site-specific DNA-methyltransferase (adenine-specific)